jgi:signal transduction histidine kinase
MDDPRPATILILEDDPGVAQLERRRLERAGHRVEVSTSAEEARAILARGGVDLLVLDYKLDGSANGLEVHRELRASGLDIPSMLVTGYSDEAMLTEAIRSGIRDFLPKNEGFLDFFLPAVERVLKQIRVERQLEVERGNLAREQSARAAAEAEKATLAQEDRRKDEFLAMLAHELRNPLSAISSAVHLARTQPSEEQVVWSNDVITRQVGHLSHLIDDLLDVSRIRLGKIQLRKRVLDLSEVIPRAVETVRPLVDRKRHGLTVALEPGPLLVEADPTRLEQILVNLLTNAAKYTEEGGRIGLSASRDSGQAVLRVTDSGEGISAEMLPRIFDLFIQVDGSLDRSQGGLGIGLTLVRTLVAMHGGSIAVASPGLGRGSTFTVHLPESARAAEAPITPEPPKAPRAGRRVLVVDDNADMARGMARFLRAAGHTVEVVHDGAAALDAARAFGPDVVLLDIGLPGMDGYEVASRLRADGFASTTILALSGYGQADDRRKSEAAGFDAHLVKPIDHDALLAIIAG